MESSGLGDGQDEMEQPASAHRACDNCRARKVRCDRKSPCFNCRASQSVCRTTVQRQQQQRQRVLISSQYERKIDRIEDRLAGIEQLLRTLALNDGEKPPTSARPSVQNDEEFASGRTPQSTLDQPEQSTTFGGETTLRAQFLFASEVLERTVAQSSSGRSAEMSAALMSLKSIVDRQGVQTNPQQTRATFRRGHGPFSLPDMEMPPESVVYDVLQEMSTDSMLVLTSVLSFLSMDRLKTLYDDLCHRREECTHAQALLVNGYLHYLFLVSKILEDSGPFRDQCEKYSLLCRNNLELLLAGLNLLMPATHDNIAALLMGASYAVDRSQPSLCWTLTSTAAALCHALGYHNIASLRNDTEEERNNKMFTFWLVYYLDKSLSLRLGRASTIQDYDISLPLPRPGSNSETSAWETMIYVWIKIAKLQGQVYEHLYSPAAFLRSEDERVRTARELAEELQEAQDIHSRIAQDLKTDHAEYASVMVLGDRVSHHSLKTLILRAIPSTSRDISFNTDCIDAARQALRAHRVSSDLCKGTSQDVWAAYIHWSILHAPFTPFMVLFCHVIAVHNTDDLQLLESFVTSLESSRQVSAGADRLYRMCHVFHLVARLYVESQVQAPIEATRDDGEDPMRLDEEFDQYLNALGFAPNASFETFGVPHDGATNARSEGIESDPAVANLRDWYGGNQYIMGLLEDDLSYLPDYPFS